ncbi:hypothetical protein ACO2Q3_20520 [Caulobacter sp. KR2-114]|uniref:hypothetical protein n=1 Tax=Caulobacter sp. KR2-114 TaxID=3400912 RepID=UPI003BFFB80A
MRTSFVRAALALILALPSAAGAAPRYTPYAAAPAQVRKDLMKIFAECGTRPEVVRSTARLETAPVGGPGRKDYLFSFGKDDWPREFKSEEYPAGGRCNSNYSWTVLWMDLGGGRFQQRVLADGAVVAKGGRYLVVESGCKATAEGPPASYAWVLAWNARHHTFEPQTRCETLDEATQWLKAQG